LGNLEKAQQIEYEAGKTVNNIVGLLGKTVTKIAEKTGNPAIAAAGMGLEAEAAGLNLLLDMGFQGAPAAGKNFLMDKAVVNAINNCPERNTSTFGLVLWLGFKQDFVEYERRSRRFGRSKWSFAKLLHLASDWIIGFSGLPLTLILAGGILVTALGFFYAIFLVINVIMGNPARGWAFVMAAVLLLSGVQMMMIGMIGEYLWRNLDESRKRPLFFIEKRSD